MDILDKAELLDGYRSAVRVSRLNAAARAEQTYDLDTLTPAAYTALGKALGSVPLAAQAELAILHPTADGGMPHTRPPNVICLPKGVCPTAEQPSRQFIDTLAHEAIHVHQRLNPELWAAYLNTRGWTPVAASKIPAEFRERIRLNPDTLQTPFWAWKRVYVPLPLFPKWREPKGLGDVTIEWLNLTTGALFHDPPARFGAKGLAALEHPYELTAYELQGTVRTVEQLEQILQSK